MKLLNSSLIVQGLQPVSSDERSIHATHAVHCTSRRPVGKPVEMTRVAGKDWDLAAIGGENTGSVVSGTVNQTNMPSNLSGLAVPIGKIWVEREVFP
jgi:hypothetical protein